MSFKSVVVVSAVVAFIPAAALALGNVTFGPAQIPAPIVRVADDDIQSGVEFVLEIGTAAPTLQEVEGSIEIIKRRIGKLGLTGFKVERQGTNRIIVQVSNVLEPDTLTELLTRTGKLEFRLIDLSMAPEEAEKAQPPAGSEVLFEKRGGQRIPYLVYRQVSLSGADLVDAQPSVDWRVRAPIVNFRFNQEAARKFATITGENVGRPFAIVLDDEVISAPIIREPILGGSGQISGNFTLESADNFAIILRAGGELPVKLKLIDQRIILPKLDLTPLLQPQP